MSHPVIVGRSRGFKRGPMKLKDGTVFRARNRPPSIQLRREGQFMEFPLEDEHSHEVQLLLDEIDAEDARHAGSGHAGSAKVCKTERAQEIFDKLWELTRG